MVEPGGDLDLGQEAIGAQDGAELGPEHLERHLALVLEIVGQIDRRHPSLAQLPLDAVAIGEDAGQSRFR